MSLLEGSGLQVLVAGRDVTDRVTGQVTFSCVDPGGYEACSFDLPADEAPVRKGDAVVVLASLQEAWWGRVEEPGAHTQAGHATYSVQAVGAGAALKDDPYACIYVDRDLSGWGTVPLARQVLLSANGYQLRGPATSQTSPAGTPALKSLVQLNGSSVDNETVYDAGPLCKIARLYAQGDGTAIGTFGNPGWDVSVGFSDGDAITTGPNYQEFVKNTAAIAFADYSGPLVPTRYVDLFLVYNSTNNTPDTDRFVLWSNLAVYGDHGLPVRGPAPGGFYPSDIARHALKQATGIVPGVIIDATGYIVPHAVYKEPTLPETVIDDMAKLMGWHWGVWGPSSVLDDQPRLNFQPPPPEATAACSRLHTEDFQLADQLSATYDSVIVAWQDAAGTRSYETVTQPNATLPDRVHRTGQVDIGTSTQAGAKVFGRYWLLLSQRAQRSGGQCTLPAHVITSTGAPRRSLTLKAGLDRLRFTDLPSDGQNLLEADARRFDTFRLKRVETTIEQGGVPRTRVEFDTGADLLSTLQTRLQAATQIATGR